MEAATDRKPQSPSDSLPGGAPDGLRAAADGTKELGANTPEEKAKAEAKALDFLLGEEPPLEYDVEVKLETDKGLGKLVFRIRQMDGARILELEDDHRDGTGPFAQLNDTAFNAALVAEATVSITDPSTGKVLTPDDMEWVGNYVSPPMAMEKRFSRQSGVLSGIAGEVRRVSGWAPGRVGQADRSMVNAAGN